MNSKVRQIILKILQIMEEFPEKAIKEAVAELRNYGKDSELFDYLVRRQHNEKRISGHVTRTAKPLSEQHSKILTELADKDKEKFKILSEFDALLRKQKILPKIEDIRELGNRISKDFPKVKSRKEAIPKLLKLLSEKSAEELRQIFQDSMSQLKFGNDTSEYQELANYIIRGSSRQN